MSLLVGQILSPGAKLVSQLTRVGGALASQIEQKGEGEEEEADGRSEPRPPRTGGDCAESASSRAASDQPVQV